MRVIVQERVQIHQAVQYDTLSNVQEGSLSVSPFDNEVSVGHALSTWFNLSSIQEVTK